MDESEHSVEKICEMERLPETVAGLHFVAFACLFLQQAAGILLAGS